MYNAFQLKRRSKTPNRSFPGDFGTFSQFPGLRYRAPVIMVAFVMCAVKNDFFSEKTDLFVRPIKHTVRGAK